MLVTAGCHRQTLCDLVVFWQRPLSWMWGDRGDRLNTIRPEIVARTFFSILRNYLTAKWRNVTENYTSHSTPISVEICLQNLSLMGVKYFDAMRAGPS